MHPSRVSTARIRAFATAALPARYDTVVTIVTTRPKLLLPGVRRAMALLGLACAAMGAAADNPAEPLAEEPPEEHLYAAPTTQDRIGRIMAPVMLNGQGPFRFVVDTGASRSVVSPRLVERLGLAQATDTRITIQGATGAEAVPSVLIEHLQAGDIRMENVRLPVVGPAVLAGADGILGVEGFDKMRIVVDFAADSISITRARKSWTGRKGWYRVPVRLRFGRLMVAQARIGDLSVKAVIDTGAERTLGNLALRDALGLGTAEHLERAQSKVIGATSTTESALTLPSPVIVFGQTMITGVDVTFGDLHVFRIWDLEQEPALVIGMDVLGTPQALMFDYRNEELQLRTGAPGKRGG